MSDFTRQLRGKVGGALLCLLGTTLLGPVVQAQTSDESSPAAQSQRDEQINQLQKRLEEMQGELDALKKANAINRAEQHYSTSKASAPHPVSITAQQNLRIPIARIRSRSLSRTSHG
jgi:TolA-binding protein